MEDGNCVTVCAVTKAESVLIYSYRRGEKGAVQRAMQTSRLRCGYVYSIWSRHTYRLYRHIGPK